MLTGVKEQLKFMVRERESMIQDLQKQLDETVAVMSQSGETPVLIKGKEEENL